VEEEASATASVGKILQVIEPYKLFQDLRLKAVYSLT
jgi:hypothetical protein